MWRTLIDNLSGECGFKPAASDPAISETEKALGIALPSELRELLKESNGVSDEYGAGLIWSAEQIRDTNREFREMASFRELYMPFDSLLFFADAGDGDQYAFTILDGVVRRSDVFIWDHETDSRTWVASSLEKYIDRRLQENHEIF